ncbi:hypothetical protein P8452_72396 [Trifolium repens]|nr:hypothetical protein P8452_72396 [Trifolium repens]
MRTTEDLDQVLFQSSNTIILYPDNGIMEELRKSLTKVVDNLHQNLHQNRICILELKANFEKSDLVPNLKTLKDRPRLCCRLRK